MRLEPRLDRLMAVLVLLLASACEKTTTPTMTEVGAGPPASDLELQADAEAAASGPAAPFADAALFFELNSTDDDLGLQLFLDADGWKRVRLLDPGRNQIVLMEAAGKLARLGITELRFESAEPSPEEVLALFPPGEYRFRGRSVEGGRLASNVVLSHDLPPAPTFTPSDGQVVDRRHAVVEWNTPGAEQVELIIEQDELGHVLDVTLSASTRRLRIPQQFLTPGTEYKIEILSIAENGNRTIAESTFRTEP
ncbi:MAG: hypothetical protein ACREM9_05390 [Gemmatimonadales bacterium]